MATKYVHQVTWCTFYSLMKQAFQQSKCYTGREQRNLTFKQWQEQMKLLYLHFQFWSIILKMQMDYLLLLSSIQSRKFNLYYMPWVNLYHGHLYLITITKPSGYPFITTTWRCCKNQIFYLSWVWNRNFVVFRTKDAFSSMKLDQRHEQHEQQICKWRKWTGCSNRGWG